MNKLTNAAFGGREKPVNYECTHRCRLPRIYIFWRHADLRLLKRVKIPIDFLLLCCRTTSFNREHMNRPHKFAINSHLCMFAYHLVTCDLLGAITIITEPRSVHIHQNYLIDRFEWLLINFPLFEDLS